MKTTLYLATGNAHKLDELQQILGTIPGLTVLGADALGGMPQVEENAPDFVGNARLKAQALLPRLAAQHTPAKDHRTYILADDSGLAVDALDGAPGVKSARYAGNKATAADNNTKLLEALASTPPTRRSARFVCVFVLLTPDSEHTFRGECPGRIALLPSGRGGFGYDPLFIPDGHTRSFADLGEDIKNQISHRAHASRALRQHLQQ